MMAVLTAPHPPTGAAWLRRLRGVAQAAITAPPPAEAAENGLRLAHEVSALAILIGALGNLRGVEWGGADTDEARLAAGGLG